MSENTGTEKLLVSDRQRTQASELLATVEDPAVSLTTQDGNPAPLPIELREVLGAVLRAMSHGRSVVVTPLPDELTTTVAADQLGISRPTLMKLISNGKLAAHRVGSHHRVRLADLQDFKRARLIEQRAAFAELTRLSEELDD